MADIRQRYGQLVAALGHKDYLLWDDDNESAAGTSNRVVDGQQQETATFYKQMVQIREALNSVKSRVNEICTRHGGVRWHSFTSFTHPLKALPGWLATRIGEASRAGQDLEVPSLYTQAFCKFVQLISAHPPILAPFYRQEKQSHKNFRTLHLCELPGAFVLALMYSLGDEQCKQLEWHVNSLNPHWEWADATSLTVCEDALMVANEAAMAFGWDQSGDLLHAWDDAYLLHHLGIGSDDAAADNKFELVTADGGYDCSDDPSAQERSLCPLIRKEVEVALKCLRRGGTLLLKLFTFFERDTIDIMARLCASFGQIRCVKPASSKPGNSEVYLLCLNFKADLNHSPIIGTILMKRILDSARALAGHQIGFIDFNLSTFRRLSQNERTKISIAKCTAVEQWGARILEQIHSMSPAQLPKFATTKSWWHALWSPSNSNKIVDLALQYCRMENDGKSTTIVISKPNVEQFFKFLRNWRQDDGSVVFARIDDAEKRRGNSITNSLFAHPAWLSQRRNVRDMCAETDVANGSIHRTKMDWLDFLITAISSNSNMLELEMVQLEVILSRFAASMLTLLCALHERVEVTFCKDGKTQLRFTQSKANLCSEAMAFLANLRATFAEKAAHDQRWTLLKFVPIEFFARPTDDGKSLSEHFAEINTRILTCD